MSSESLKTKAASIAASVATQPLPFGNFQSTDVTPNVNIPVPVFDVVTKALEGQREKNSQYYPYSAEAAHMTAVASTWAYSDAQMLSNVMKQTGLEINAIDEVKVVNPALLL